jgi:hypothetical protein
MFIREQDLHTSIKDELKNTLYQQDYASIFKTGVGKDSGGVYQDLSNKVRGQTHVKVEGFSANNAVSNGDFNNGTAGWQGFNSTISASNNTLENTGNGTTATPYTASNLFYLVPGHKYYVSINARVTNAVCSSINIRIPSTPVQDVKAQAAPAQNTWYKISEQFTPATGGAVGILIWHNYASAAIASGKVMEVRDVICIDLTVLFGAGNEPAKAQCDFMFDHYINGLQGVGSDSIVSRGKNLLPLLDNQIGNINGTDEIWIDPTSTTRRSTRIKARPNTSYVFSISGNYRMSWADVDLNNRLLAGSTAWQSGSVNIVTSPSTAYLFISVSRNDNAAFTQDDFPLLAQFEEGLTPTTYEAYKSTSLSFILPEGMNLNRLPNGVTDTIEEINGVMTLTKRTAELTLVSGNVGAVTTGIYLDYAYITVADSNLESNILGTYILQGFPEVSHTGFDTDINMYKTFAANILGEQRVYFTFTKGTTLSQAQALINGLKLIYQLVTPQVYVEGKNSFNVEGTLEAYSNGTIYQELATSKNSCNAKLYLDYNLNDKALVLYNGRAINRLGKRAILKGNDYRPNILTNGDFQIWQRGQSFDKTVTTGRFYAADRWCCFRNSYAAGLTVVKNGKWISIINPSDGNIAMMQQSLEQATVRALRGKTITVSIKVKSDQSGRRLRVYIPYSKTVELVPGAVNDGTIIGVESVISNNDFTIISATGVVPDDANGLAVHINAFSGAETLTIEYVKLEVNDHATSFIPKNYGEELALCQRYCIPLASKVLNFYAYSTNNIWFETDLPSKMRVNPTLIGNIETTNFTIQNYNTNKVNGFSVSSVNMFENQLSLIVLKNAHGLTGNYCLQFVPGVNSYLDAEI